ncbi:MAG: ATP-dependent helicase [candidate division SR1 bacterium]|nr:ATP-dependent helicase [candidate division SR1 bacterium]
MQNQNIFLKNYERLNDKQKLAVDKIEGPLLVIAGPGSGKTQILSMRVANILQKTDSLPQSILCLTFTDAAAKNMLERLVKIIGIDAFKINIHTFHSFATDIIGKYPEVFFLGAQFTPLEEIARVEILENLFSKLDYTNKLSSRHPELGWVYKKDVENMIKDLKAAGILPDEFNSILKENLAFLQQLEPYLQELFSTKITRKTIDLLPNIIEKINEIPYKSQHIPRINSYKKTLLVDITSIYSECKAKNNTKAITEFKDRVMKKNDQNILALRDLLKTEYLKSTCDIYESYQEQLFSKGLFDFSDMIVEINKALQNNTEFRYDLQEQFQYILVDEFQDTNGAQLSMIKGLVDMELSDGSPNIMVVGDDDQAIYRFQGANIDNIRYFYEMFNSVELIVLDTNYRSPARIVDFSHQIIAQGNSKLQSILNISKQIRAFEQTRHSRLHHIVFNTVEEELVWVGEEIQILLESGINPGEIAVLARTHKSLEMLAHVAYQFKIPVNYEKGQNILKQPHIAQLVTILKYIGSWINDSTRFEKDDLLPSILSFDFWKISPIELYDLSLESSKTSKTWMQILTNEELKNNYSKKLQDVAQFLLYLGVSSVELPAERLIDLIVGSAGQSIADSEQEEYDINLNSTVVKIFISPFKSYYFPKIKMDQDKLVSQEYTSMLSGLRSLVTMVREYNPSKLVKVQEVLEVIEMYQKNNISLVDTSPFVIQSNAVNLMTVHKSKGLEFEYVFIVNASEETWKPGSNKTKLPFPLNMPIGSELDEEDDVLRLFYVAITRAKNQLYITCHTTSKGKQMKKIRYLAGFEDGHFDECAKHPKNDDSQRQALELMQAQIDQKYNYVELRSVLQNQLDNYIMSVTHLNNFLDLEHAGPEVFLENNLLRFPQSKDPSSGYGTAMHNALRDFYVERARTYQTPSKEYVFERFKWGMKKERLNNDTLLIKKGLENLEYYLDNALLEVDIDTEVPFRYENVKVGDAILAGNIDKIVYLSRPKTSTFGICEVVDYKTGSGGKNWKDLERKSPMKWLKYRQQLIFYKILVEKSRRFGGRYTVNTGKIDFIESISKSSTPEHNILEMEITSSEVKNLENLIDAVWKCIKTLNLPDVSSYSKDIKGTKQFIQDLLDGKYIS